MKSALPWLILVIATADAFAQDLTQALIAADRALWPKTVVVSVPLEAPVIIAGKESGKINLPAGREYPVKAVGADNVTIDLGGSFREVAGGETDLLVKAAAVKGARDAYQAKVQAAVAMATPVPIQRAPTPAATPASQFHNAVGEKLSNLVALDGKKLTPFDSGALANKKYIAVYYSGSWCGPCRKFTPDLVKWYKRNKSKAELFELVFVSADRSAEQMAAYMVDDKMPWPALEFCSIKMGNPIVGKGGPGIPSLVVFDASGTAVAESYVNGNYVGPRKVLEDFEKMLRKTE
ncbi:MAG: thioredoxin-like domain-containing protein [Verrucomicrobiae bacterium]